MAAEIREFRRPLDSRRRVNALAAAAIIQLDNARRRAEEMSERDRIRRLVCLEAGLAIQKMYVLLGIEETDRLLPWLQSAKREEAIAKTRR